MFNFDYITKEDIKEHNANWSQIPDHTYRILIVEGYGIGKTNALLNISQVKYVINQIKFFIC